LKEEFLDIVAVIVKQMSEGEASGPRDRNIIEGLLDEGYDLMDIDDALSWFESIADGAGEMGGVEFWPGFKGLRVQARWEKEAMTQGAFAYLMKLNRAGFVEDSFREAIVDKVVDLSIADFGVEQMKALLGLVLYSKGALTPEDAFYRLVDRGQGSLLN
jgi:uncharacterized protein Smg (DUF494 family)